MDAEGLPPAIHEIAIYTDQVEIKGRLTAWPPRRVLDVLNTREVPLLTVEQASVIPLSRWGRAQPSVADSVVLNKHEIVLVWPVRETKVEANDFVTIHKVPEKVVAYAGAFVAQGMMHVIREATLAQAWDAVKEEFIALTEPSVFCLTVPGLSLTRGTVVAINASKTLAIHGRK
jgi:hypothetical protein